MTASVSMTMVALPAPAPARLDVPAGVVDVAGVEYGVEAFRIDARATTAAEPPAGCKDARGEEWLAAARLPEFVPSQAFEQLTAPPDEPCSYSKEVLEAEGIEGWVHFAGLGSHKGQETQALRPTDRAVLETLLTGYRQAGMKTDADDLAKKLAQGGKGTRK